VAQVQLAGVLGAGQLGAQLAVGVVEDEVVHSCRLRLGGLQQQGQCSQH
jgi:hypothetical protein